MGVDIGSFAVKVVQLRRASTGWFVTAAGIVDISEKGTDNPGRKEANSARAVHNCMRLTGVKAKQAVCGVGGAEVVVRNFEFPKIPEEQIERAIMLEAKQVCPFNTDQIAVDYRLIPDGNDKTKGYLVVATDKLVKSMVRLTSRAHLNCALMDVEGLALLNCFNQLEKPEKNHGTAILNIGSHYTTLAVEGEGGWPFIRNLNYAGDSIIEGIAAENDMTPDAVRTLFAGDPKEIPANIQESFERACNRLINDINKTVRYYGAQGRSSDIRKILVSGGFALFGKLVKIIDSSLPMDVELWNPFEKMRCQVARNHRGVLVKSILRKNGPALAVAAGLAMRAI
ncbi:MAG: type IV pilus assembly protein PilM [Planctomycetota bacterium]